MCIDAHQHYWSLGRKDYSWISPKRPVLNRDYLPKDLEPFLVRNDVEQTIVVQSTPTLAETEFLLLMAESEATIAGVVGWVDMASPSALRNLDRFADHRKFCGIRMMAQGKDDPNWLEGSEFSEGLNRLTVLDKSLDVLVREEHLGALERLIVRHPNLRVLINHAAKPTLTEKAFHSWSVAMRRLAGYPNVYCKLSGLTAAASAYPTAEDFAPFVQEIIASFGPARVIWASDWPVLNETSDYDAWMALTDELLASLSPKDCEQIMGKNAKAAYRLSP